MMNIIDNTVVKVRGLICILNCYKPRIPDLRSCDIGRNNKALSRVYTSMFISFLTRLSVV